MRKKNLLISLFLTLVFVGAGFGAAHAKERGAETKGETSATVKMAGDEQIANWGHEYVRYDRDGYYRYPRYLYPSPYYYGPTYRYRDPYYGYRYHDPYYGRRGVSPYYGQRYDYRHPSRHYYYDGRPGYNFGPRRYDYDRRYHGHYRYYYRGY